MTEKEFRKLVSDVEVSKKEKEEILQLLETIKNKMIKYHYTFEIVDMYRGGALQKGTMLNYSKEYDFILVVKPCLNKIFQLTNKVILTEIVNSLIVNLDEITKISDINVSAEKNEITIMLDDKVINLYIYYTENSIADFPQHLLENVEQKRTKFVEIANKEYSYFRNTIQIIKYYRDEQKISIISGLTLEVILYYALREYCFDTRYEDYLNAFLKGLDDFINGKKIEVYPPMYEELDVETKETVKKQYMAIDPGTGYLNLTDDVNDIKIGEYRKLRKAIAKLVDTKSLKDLGTGVVKLNVTPQKNNDGTYSWCYKIEETNLTASGGTYTSSDDDTYTAIFKALLKGMKSIIDNNLNRKQVEIICPKKNILNNESGLSTENNARRKNVLAYMDNNQIKVI